MAVDSKRQIRFGAFEVDLAAGEVRKNGRPVRLQDQPFRILKSLLKRPGEVVTREELRQEIWGEDVYVDFDRSLNTSVARLREALGDSPTRPDFIETVPRKGYRFIGPLASPQPEEGTGAPEPAVETVGRREWTIAAAGLAVLLGAVVAAFAWLPSGPKEAETVVAAPERLTSYLGAEGEVDFSPDGSQIAFTWNGEDEDNYDIYVRAVDGGKPHRLTTHAGVDASPAWSPDGQWIAFRRDHGDGTGGLYRISPTGGFEEKLLGYPTGRWRRARSIGWAPDSRHMAIVDPSGDGASEWAIVLYDIQSGSRTPLVEQQFSIHPQFSPDGRSLAYSIYGIGCFILPLTQTLGPAGPPRPVEFGQSCFSPTWKPGGSRLIIEAELEGALPALWSVRPDGSDPRRLPVNASAHGGSGLLLPAAGKGGTVAYRQILTRAPIWRLDLETGEAEPLIESSGRNDSALYSPDGKKILFRSNRGPEGTWLADADGRNAFLLVEGGRDASWSPDGNWIVFRALKPGNPTERGPQDLWVMSAQGGPARPLTQSSEHEATPIWSQDGEWVYYLSPAEGQVWRVPSAGGEPELVLDVSASPREMSADGRWLYLILWGERSTISRLSSDGVREDLVEGVLGMGWWGMSVGSTGIYYQAKDPDGPYEIRFYSFSSRSSETIYRTDRYLGRVLDLSPDERYLIFSQPESDQADLMIIEGVR